MRSGGIVILVTLLALSGCRGLVYTVSSSSMEPTLLSGDRVALRPFGKDGPARGDVVAFLDASGIPYIKRIAGLPGDRVQMRSGVLWIDDSPAAQTEDGIWHRRFLPDRFGTFPRCENQPALGGDCTARRLVETLPDGRSHAILDLEEGSQMDDTGVFVVPPDSYFVLGDDRDNSADSRIPVEAGGQGFVPAAALLGRINTVLFSSLDGMLLPPWDWRPERSQMAVE